MKFGHTARPAASETKEPLVLSRMVAAGAVRIFIGPAPVMPSNSSVPAVISNRPWQ